MVAGDVIDPVDLILIEESEQPLSPLPVIHPKLVLCFLGDLVRPQLQPLHQQRQHHRPVQQIFIQLLRNRRLDRADQPGRRVSIDHVPDQTARTRIKPRNRKLHPPLFFGYLAVLRRQLDGRADQEQAQDHGPCRPPSPTLPAALQLLHDPRSTEIVSIAGNSIPRSWRRRASRSNVSTVGTTRPS